MMVYFKNDEERAKYACPEKGPGHNVQAVYEDAWKKGKADVNALTIFDAIANFWKETHANDSIFLYDLRRGLRNYAIGFVNAGADDFNSAANDLCPSIMVSRQFQMALEGKKELELRFSKALAGKTTPASREYAGYVASLNDLLYIFKKLKEGKGLNQKVIDAYPDKVEIQKTMEKMNKYLLMPEEKRWIAEEMKVKPSPSLIMRFLGRQK